MEANDEAVGPPPPAAAGWPPARVPRRHAAVFRAPLGGRRSFAVAALALCGVLAVVSAWQNFGMRQFLASLPPEGIDSADTATLAKAEDIDEAVGATALLAAAARVLCAVAFLVWFYRAHENLRTSGFRLERGSGWVVGSIFVPIAGLFVPVQGMLDVWKGSRALAGEAPLDQWRRTPASPIVLAWWLTFLGSSLIAIVSDRMTGSDVPGLLTAAGWLLASDVVEIFAAAAAIVIVLRVTAMQSRAPLDQLAEVFR